MVKLKLPCEIVEDLLPTYADGLTGTVTNQAVEEHLRDCNTCRDKYRAMKAPGDYAAEEEEKKEIDYLKKTRKHTALKIVLAVLGTLLLAFVCFVYIAFNGSILQKLRYTKLAKEYIAEHYPDSGYVVDRAVYDFKMNSYYCTVKDPNSIDTHFTVYPENGNGLLRDDYENRVTSLWNTRMRLSNEVRKAGDALFADLPWRQRLMGLDVYEDTDMKGLYLDMPFDLYHFPGELEFTLWIETDGEEPTWEELEEKLVAIKAYVESKGVSPVSYSVLLEYPYTENKNHDLEPTQYGSNVCVFDVPASVIDDPEALHERLEHDRLEIERELEDLKNGEYDKDSYDKAAQQAQEAP